MILYEDKALLVCHKPAGIPVQSASVREKDMVSLLRNHLGSDIHVVHRLDQPVEGILVFAKTKSAAAGLSRQITDGSMRKIYHAVAEVTAQADLTMCADCDSKPGTEAAPWHTLIDYLKKDGRNNRSFVTKENENGAKRAELRYRILKYKAANCIPSGDTTLSKEHSSSADSVPEPAGTGFALVEIELLTGRHHQIRVQMAHAGLPLIGDRKYNPNYCTNSSQPSPSLALCAVSLTFRHPTTNKPMTFDVQPQGEIFTTF
ncbi:MAG: RluA family pseudouridine synthase [Lachnospiraceae bacterium]|nr:RluA family pseudouridine synthase [Lachnospiraceae bacterium]